MDGRLASCESRPRLRSSRSYGSTGPEGSDEPACKARALRLPTVSAREDRQGSRSRAGRPSAPARNGPRSSTRPAEPDFPEGTASGSADTATRFEASNAGADSCFPRASDTRPRAFRGIERAESGRPGGTARSPHRLERQGRSHPVARAPRVGRERWHASRCSCPEGARGSGRPRRWAGTPRGWASLPRRSSGNARRRTRIRGAPPCRRFRPRALPADSRSSASRKTTNRLRAACRPAFLARDKPRFSCRTYRTAAYRGVTPRASSVEPSSMTTISSAGTVWPSTLSMASERNRAWFQVVMTTETPGASAAATRRSREESRPRSAMQRDSARKHHRSSPKRGIEEVRTDCFAGSRYPARWRRRACNRPVRTIATLCAS